MRARPVVTSGAFDPSAVTRRQVGTFSFRTCGGSWAATDITGKFYLNRVLRTRGAAELTNEEAR